LRRLLFLFRLFKFLVVPWKYLLLDWLHHLADKEGETAVFCDILVF
jgi:hypothetical protein